MVYVFILLTLLLIVGPIIAILPTARQKERMKMRMAARAVGVSVELSAINDPNEKQLGGVIEIGRRLSSTLKVGKSSFSLCRCSKKYLIFSNC